MDDVLAADEREFIDNMRALAYRAFARTLTAERTIPRLVKVMDQVNRLTDIIPGHLLSTAASPSIACEAGCEWCCHQPVAVSPPEVIRIGEQLRESLSAGELASLRARMADNGGGLGETNQAGTASCPPCDLLVNALCSVYPVRPLICRLFHATDAEQCRHLFLRTPGAETQQYSVPFDAALRIRHGLAMAAKEIGLEAAALDLRAALQIALGSDRAAERWLAGERVFASAELRRAGTTRIDGRRKRNVPK